jgi:hypothetical protein
MNCARDRNYQNFHLQVKILTHPALKKKKGNDKNKNATRLEGKMKELCWSGFQEFPCLLSTSKMTICSKHKHENLNNKGKLPLAPMNFQVQYPTLSNYLILANSPLPSVSFVETHGQHPNR